jgi:muconolactone delta-isomerase
MTQFHVRMTTRIADILEVDVVGDVNIAAGA